MNSTNPSLNHAGRQVLALVGSEERLFGETRRFKTTDFELVTIRMLNRNLVN